MDNDKIFQLALAIIPGMMARYTKEEKSDPQVVVDAFLLAADFQEKLLIAGGTVTKGI
jgi:hypothetical protein